MLAVLVVCALALLNAAFGFLGSATLTATGNAPTPLGSVYAVAGWIPALLILSGLAAAATRLDDVSVPTLWATSAAAAVTGGVGALFYLVAQGGTDAGLGFVLRSNESSVGSSVSAGLVLIVLFGLLQLVAALGGLLLTQSPRLAHRTPRPAKAGPDAAHRYSPGPGAPGQGQPGPQGGQWAPQNEFRYPAFQGYGNPAYGPPSGHPGVQNPAPGDGMYTRPGGPPSPGIAPYAAYGQQDPVAAAGARPSDDGRSAPQGWTGPGSPQPNRGPEPSFYDPQSGNRVHTGLTESSPPPQAPTSIPAPVPADGPPLPTAATPAEYRRTEYGSPDFEWEPTYSEAPTYEARAEEEEAEESARPEVVHYEAPDQRPQYEPPRLDSARHEGWDAGFAEDTLTGTEQPPSDRDGPRYRSIPRAE
ncbi:MAG: hypothetical protein ABIR83_15850 [Nakamurella sp.]